MSSRTIIAVTVGALLGLCLGSGAGVALPRMRSQARVTAAQTEWNAQPVTVAAATLPVGTVVTAGALTTHPVPAAYITDAIVTPERADGLVGQRVLMTIEAGEPLRWAYVEKTEPLPGLDLERAACEAALSARAAANRPGRPLP